MLQSTLFSFLMRIIVANFKEFKLFQKKQKSRVFLKNICLSNYCSKLKKKILKKAIHTNIWNSYSSCWTKYVSYWQRNTRRKVQHRTPEMTYWHSKDCWLPTVKRSTRWKTLTNKNIKMCSSMSQLEKTSC